MKRSMPLLPSEFEVARAHEQYLSAEGRDVVYRVARDLVERGYRGESAFTVGEGVAVLLLSWNASFYRPRPALVRTVVADLDRLVNSHAADLVAFRSREVRMYNAATDRLAVEQIYRDFVRVLWPVGTAKALHVLAPEFFPLWDSEIAHRFKLPTSPREVSVGSYLRLMDIGHEFAAGWRGPAALKALDEWAYVEFTVPRRRGSA